jgi:hypothetical protein
MAGRGKTVEGRQHTPHTRGVQAGWKEGGGGGMGQPKLEWWDVGRAGRAERAGQRARSLPSAHLDEWGRIGLWRKGVVWRGGFRSAEAEKNQTSLTRIRSVRRRHGGAWWGWLCVVWWCALYSGGGLRVSCLFVSCSLVNLCASPCRCRWSAPQQHRAHPLLFFETTFFMHFQCAAAPPPPPPPPHC